MEERFGDLKGKNELADVIMVRGKMKTINQSVAENG